MNQVFILLDGLEKNNNFNLAINKVYKELNKKDKNWFIKNKNASFVCALTIYWPNNSFVTVIGKVSGTISKYTKGIDGFGYDPIFIPKNSKLTFGQMKLTLKYKIDHRMKAFKKIKKFSGFAIPANAINFLFLNLISFLHNNYNKKN